MTDKVQKIREEVERLKLCTMDEHMKFYSESAEAEYNALCKIDAYIDSLQEEPTFKVGDRIRIKGTTVKGDVIKNIYQAEGGNTYFEFENSDDALANEMWELVEDHKEFKPIRKKQPEGVLKELLDNMDEKELKETRKEMLQEEPVSIDFEQELYKAFGQVKDFTLGMRIAKWFYDMGKNSQEPVSEDLEEVSKEYADKNYAEWLDFISGDERDDYYTISEAFKAGAQWQKNKMMEDAVDGVVAASAGGDGWVNIATGFVKAEDVNVKFGDKIKIIVVKED